MYRATLKPAFNRRRVRAIELPCHKTGLASGEIVQGGGLGSGGLLPPPWFDSSRLPWLMLQTLLLFSSSLGLYHTSSPGAYSVPDFPNHLHSSKAHSKPGFRFLWDLWLLCFWYNSIHIGCPFSAWIRTKLTGCEMKEKRFLVPPSAFQEESH